MFSRFKEVRNLSASAGVVNGSFLGLEQNWFDKKNPKWLKSSKIRGNLNCKGGSIDGKTG
jgi:hypothetical protein